MPIDVKLFLPKDEKIINAVLVNLSNGDATYLPIEKAIKLEQKLKNRALNINLETVYLGVGETHDIIFEEDAECDYKVEVIPKRKNIPTPPKFKSQTDLYEIVVDKCYKVNYFEHEEEHTNNRHKEPSEQKIQYPEEFCER